MIKKHKNFLIEMSARWGLTLTKPLKFFIYNNYHPHCTNIDIFWFHAKGKFPCVVTKLSRDRTPLEREYENLKKVFARGLACVPRPLYCGPSGEFHTLWMTGVPGFQIKSGDKRVGKYLDGLVDAIIDLHGRLRSSDSGFDRKRITRFVDEPLETVSKYGTSDAVQRCCRSLQQYFSNLSTDRIPVILQHGDLFIGNVLRDGRQYYFVDWETFGLVDLPFYDLFTFFASFLSGFGDNPEHWPECITKQLPRLIRKYANHLGLLPINPVPFFRLTLVNWFHILHLDGRQEVARQRYEFIERYLENEHLWQAMLFERY